MLELHVEPGRPSEAELDFIRAGMRRHAEQFVLWQEYEDLTIALRDPDGKLWGVGLGETGRGWLKVSLLWIHEDHRGAGYGTHILAKLESEGVRRGCQMAFLDTFSYQARPFYERHGYTVFGQLDDYPPGHTRYYMSKRLVGEA